MQHALLVVAMITVVGISACDDEEEGPTVFNGSIMDLIGDTQFKQSASVPASMALDSLHKYLSIYSDLVDLLDGATEYTLFAPNNEAFISLLALPGFPADIRDINPDIIKGVLSYHIVAGTSLQSDLTSGTELTTLFTNTQANPDDKIIVNADGSLKTGSTNQAIQIVDADNRATNGVVHVTGTVLIPQTVGASITQLLGTPAGTVFLATDFTYLAQMINNADEGVAAQDQIRTLLATPSFEDAATSTVSRTFFAPPNAFFEAAAAAASEATGQEVTVEDLIEGFGTGEASRARAILLNHIVTEDDGTIYTHGDVEGDNDVQFTNSMTMQSHGEQLNVLFTDPQPDPAQEGYNPLGIVIYSANSEFAPLAQPDILQSNGSVVHAILGFIEEQ